MAIPYLPLYKFPPLPPSSQAQSQITGGEREREREREIMTLITEELKAKAEIYYGDVLGQEKSKHLLQEVGLPGGLLPLKDIIECGYVEETGFVWLKQKNKIEHCFDKIGKQVIYGAEITAYVDKLRIKKLTGVKAKELLMWISISDIYVEDSSSTKKIIFKNPTGIFRTFPFSAFEVEENKEEKVNKEVYNDEKKMNPTPLVEEVGINKK